MDWLQFLCRRLLGAATVVAMLVVVTFAIVRLVPGNPARNVAGLTASPSVVTAISRQLGLDRPLADQFASYVTGLLHGNLGTSFQTGEPVSQIIRDRLPATAELAGLALIVVLALGIPCGMMAAAFSRKRNGLDHAVTAVTSLGGAIPEYISATLLVLVFAMTLGILPVAENTGPSSVVLPVAAVAIAPTCVLIRIMRREVLRSLGQEYIVTARSKYLPGWRIYIQHVLPNAITGSLTIGGLLFAALLGGTVTVEAVFAWPGLGTAIVHAIETNDYPAVQGSILLLGIVATAVTLGVDIALAIADPRTRSARIEGGQ